MDQLEIRELAKEGEDKWLWKEGEFMTYTVKFAYKVLRKLRNDEDRVMYDFFYKIKVLPSTQVVAWRVLHNKVAT